MTKGVDVFVSIRDPNGDYYSDIVTTDGNGVFSLMWAPAFVGKYEVSAKFEGSNSYYSSYATTAFGVDQAPEEYPDVPTAEEIAADAAQRTINMLPQYPATPDIPEIPAYLTIDLAIIAAVVIAIIIGLYGIIKKQK
jgi:hypothetical protein